MSIPSRSVSIFLIGLALAAPGAAQDRAAILAAARSGDATALAEALPGATPGDLGRPLFFAAGRGHLDAVALLLEHGADPGAAFGYGGALHAAAAGGHGAVVALLLERGADPGTPAGEFGNTPLHEAARAGRGDVLRQLLAAGADVNARNSRDEPPLHLAVDRGHAEIAALLRAAGAGPRPVPMPDDAILATATPEAGWLAVGGCRNCHQFTGDEADQTFVGPSLIGLVGRPVGGLPGYPYSPAMAMAGGTWTLEALNRFLGDTYGTVPGTAMYWPSRLDEAERAAALALLAEISRAAE